MSETDKPYPADLVIDYPDRELDRVTTFFRGFLVLPILLLLILLAGPIADNETIGAMPYVFGFIGLLSVPVAMMLLFRQKYPRWWFDWNRSLTGFTMRVYCYGMLLRDEYPSTDEEQAVHLALDYPNAQRLDRWLPLVKWLLIIPHVIVLAVLDVAAQFCVVIAWFAILFTGRYPRGLFDFVVGVLRWNVRVLAYAFLLVTDEYPPFSLN